MPDEDHQEIKENVIHSSPISSALSAPKQKSTQKATKKGYELYVPPRRRLAQGDNGARLEPQKSIQKGFNAGSSKEPKASQKLPPPPPSSSSPLVPSVPPTIIDDTKIQKQLTPLSRTSNCNDTTSSALVKPTTKTTTTTTIDSSLSAPKNDENYRQRRRSTKKLNSPPLSSASSSSKSKNSPSSSSSCRASPLLSTSAVVDKSSSRKLFVPNDDNNDYNRRRLKIDKEINSHKMSSDVVGTSESSSRTPKMQHHTTTVSSLSTPTPPQQPSRRYSELRNKENQQQNDSEPMQQVDDEKKHEIFARSKSPDKNDNVVGFISSSSSSRKVNSVGHVSSSPFQQQPAKIKGRGMLCHDLNVKHFIPISPGLIINRPDSHSITLAPLQTNTQTLSVTYSKPATTTTTTVHQGIVLDNSPVDHQSSSTPTFKQQQQQQQTQMITPRFTNIVHPNMSITIPSSLSPAPPYKYRDQSGYDTLEKNASNLYTNLQTLIKSDSSFDVAHALNLGFQIQNIYSTLLKQDPKLASDRLVAQKCWKHSFYELFKILSGVKENASVSLEKNFKKEAEESWIKFVDQTIEFYVDLISHYEQYYKLSVLNHVTFWASDLRFSACLKNVKWWFSTNPTSDVVGNEDPDKFSKFPAIPWRQAPEFSKKISYSFIFEMLHRFELALGDLHRYRLKSGAISLNQSTASCIRQAIKHYEIAVQLNPENGRPYNQLAIVAQSKRKKLETVYYYFRSLSVKHKYDGASESMKLVLDLVHQKVKEYEREFDEYMKQNLPQNAALISSEPILKRRQEIWLNLTTGQKTESFPKEHGLTLNECELAEQYCKYQQEWASKCPTKLLSIRFHTYFLGLSSLMFHKIDLDRFDAWAERSLIQFRELLSRFLEQSGVCQWTAKDLVQLTFVCVFNLENCFQQTQNISQSIFLCQNPFRLLLSVFGLFLENLCCILPPPFESSTGQNLVDEFWNSNFRQCPKNRPLEKRASPISDILPALQTLSNYLASERSTKKYKHLQKLEHFQNLRFQLNFMAILTEATSKIENVLSFRQKTYTKVEFRLPEDFMFCPFFDVFPVDPPAVQLNASEDLDFALVQARLRLILENLKKFQTFKYRKENDDETLLKSSGKTDDVIVKKLEIVKQLDFSDDEQEKRLVFEKRIKASDDEEENLDLSSEMIHLTIQKKDHEIKEQLRQLENEKTLTLVVSPKYLVPDTNTWVDHLDFIEQLLDSKAKFLICVSYLVHSELEKLAQKLEKHTTMTQAKAALNFIDKKFQSYVNGSFSMESGSLRWLLHDGQIIRTNQCFKSNFVLTKSVDDHILESCEMLGRKSYWNQSSSLKSDDKIQRQVVLLTNDRNLRVKAMASDVPVKTLLEFVFMYKELIEN